MAKPSSGSGKERHRNGSGGASETPDGALSGLLISDTYRVLGLIGSGSAGDVYEAEHVRLGVRVAAKFLRNGAEAGPSVLSRFRQEARLLAGLDDPNVVRVLDCGELANGLPYLVMERLAGEDLRTRLRRTERLGVEEAVRIGLEACRGLAAIHRAGIVHRDLKPANLYLSPRGDREVCKIVDFGLAKAALGSVVTREHVVVGTARYMAKEQVVSPGSVGAATDVHALGVILYECLTGTVPHVGETLEELMFDIVHRDPRPVQELRPGLPARLARAVDSAVARAVEDRPSSAVELARELDAFLKDTSERMDPTLQSVTLPHDLIPRHALPGRAVTLGAAVLIGALGFAAGRSGSEIGTRNSPESAAALVTSSLSVRAVERASESRPAAPSSEAPPAVPSTSAPPVSPGPSVSAPPRRRIARTSGPSPAVAPAFLMDSPYRAP
jgi:serine/threonine-protein kinase